MNDFNGVYKGKTILVTGHTGFKGSWLAIWLTALGAKVVGYAPEDIESKIEGKLEMEMDLVYA